MKIKTIILCIILLAVSRSITAQQQKTILVLKDYSASIDSTDATQIKEDALLRTVLVKEIQNVGDQVVLSYIFANSGSVVNEKTLVFSMPKSKGNKAMQRSKSLKYKLAFINSVITALKSDEPRSNQTRILASLPRIAYWSDKSEGLRVLLLSDLLEASPRRVLDDLTSKGDAQQKADIDAQALIKDFHLKSSHNNDLIIDAYIPLEMMHTAAGLEFIHYYWRKVFSQVFPSSTLNFHTL